MAIVAAAEFSTLLPLGNKNMREELMKAVRLPVGIWVRGAIAGFAAFVLAGAVSQPHAQPTR